MTMKKSGGLPKRSTGMAGTTMPAGLFKAKCLSIMEEVRTKRRSVVITKRGKPIAKLVPVDSPADDFYGFMRGKGTIIGDIIKPVIPAEEWGSD